MKTIKEVSVITAGESGCDIEDIAGALEVLTGSDIFAASSCLLDLIFQLINRLLGTNLQTS